jgi:hypothetical protein
VPKCTPALPPGAVKRVVAVGASEAALAAAVVVQPVSIGIEADHPEFQHYGGGVFKDMGCGTKLDHGVLSQGDTATLHDHWLPFLEDSHRSLAAIAVIVCQMTGRPPSRAIGVLLVGYGMEGNQTCNATDPGSRICKDVETCCRDAPGNGVDGWGCCPIEGAECCPAPKPGDNQNCCPPNWSCCEPSLLHVSLSRAAGGRIDTPLSSLLSNCGAVSLEQ